MKSKEELKRENVRVSTSTCGRLSTEIDRTPRFIDQMLSEEKSIIFQKRKLHDRKAAVMVSHGRRDEVISHEEETQSKKRKCSEIDTRKEQSVSKKLRNNETNYQIQNPLMPEMSPKNRQKYWPKRRSLFSKFDEGIQLDEESFYSVTPEKVAKEHAIKCKCNVIIDAFCGAGGNTIQFAMTCNKVIAIDIDPKKIEMAKNNASIYNVGKKIDFIVGDFLELINDLKADVVFLSPPWGGPSYIDQEVFDLKTLQPASISTLLSAASLISKNVAAFLPRNSDTTPLKEAGCVMIEENFSNKKKVIGITVYFNDLPKAS